MTVSFEGRVAAIEESGGALGDGTVVRTDGSRGTEPDTFVGIFRAAKGRRKGVPYPRRCGNADKRYFDSQLPAAGRPVGAERNDHPPCGGGIQSGRIGLHLERTDLIG